MKQVDKIIYTARSARCNDRDSDRIAHRAQHGNIKAAANAVGVDRIDNDLSGAVSDAAAYPLDCLQSGIVSAAARKDMQLTADTLYIDRQNNTLVAVALCRLTDQSGISDSAGIDAYLVRAAAENALEIVESTDTAADRQRDKYPAAGLRISVNSRLPSAEAVIS